MRLIDESREYSRYPIVRRIDDAPLPPVRALPREQPREQRPVIVVAPPVVSIPVPPPPVVTGPSRDWVAEAERRLRRQLSASELWHVQYSATWPELERKIDSWPPAAPPPPPPPPPMPSGASGPSRDWVAEAERRLRRPLTGSEMWHVQYTDSWPELERKITGWPAAPAPAPAAPAPAVPRQRGGRQRAAEPARAGRVVSRRVSSPKLLLRALQMANRRGR